MAYYSGTANSLSDLQAAILAACSIEGWTLLGSDTLQMGVGYFQFSVSGNSLRVRGGTGFSGGALAGVAPGFGRLGLPTLGAAMTYPVLYEVHIHSDPDEVYVVVNTTIDVYTWLAFGTPNVSGLPGSGAWFAGSWADFSVNTGVSISPTTGGVGTSSGSNHNQSAALFWQTQSYENSFVHHDFDSGGWGGAGPSWSAVSNTGFSVAVNILAPLIGVMPSSWNNEAVLLPIQPHTLRSSSKRSLVADLGHARYTRLDNYDPGQIITLGGERWKAYPWYRKNSSARDGGTGVTHTGTLGWAIRYDGP